MKVFDVFLNSNSCYITMKLQVIVPIPISILWVLLKAMWSMCLCSNDLPEDPHINKLLGALTEKPGFGTRCMEGESTL